MKRVVTMSAFCICLMVGIPGAARATPILGGAGLTNPASTLTFDELGDLTFQPITNQFAAYGAVFGPPAQSIGGIGWTWFPPPFPVQGFSNGYIGGNAFTGIFMQFNQVLSAAAFAVSSATDPFLFQALLNGLVVDQFQMTVGAPGYIGFQNVRFNAIRITSFDPLFGENELAIDNLQMIATPEPAALLLLGTGLVLVAAIRRRHRR